MNWLIAAIAFTAVSCATMVNGRHHTVSVDSFPSGAKIAVRCGDVPEDGGVTPAKVKVERAAAECLLTLSLDGYEPRVIALAHQPSRATKLNAIWGVPSAALLGVLGALWDDQTGGDGSTAVGGVTAGYEFGSNAATSVDAQGGGMKWVPGRIFVTLVRTEIARAPRDEGE